MSTQNNTKQKTGKMTSIGGQALIEGLMMIGPDKTALAVRKADGEIAVEMLSRGKAWRIEKVPFVRGSIKLWRQMVLGMRSLFRSADLAELLADEESPASSLQGAELAGADDSKEAELPAEKGSKAAEKSSWLSKHNDLAMFLLTVVALILTVFLFILLPNLVADILSRLSGLNSNPGRFGHLFLTLVEGVIRVLIFITYLYFTRKSKDIVRVWQYHGAEHKTIACYEAGLDLTTANVRRFSRFHPRCGTSFMFIVMIVSIILLAFVGWYSTWLNVVLRLLLLPVIAGISYELIKLTGRYHNTVTRCLSWPGLALQKLTTAEPDETMLEVAIAAMSAVIPSDNSDNW